MQYKISRHIIVDERKLELLIRLGCKNDVIFDAIIGNKVAKTGDQIIDENLESLATKKEFKNWGGRRKGAGRKRNQLDNQLDNQDANQDSGHLEAIATAQAKACILDKNVGNLSTTRTKFVPPTEDEVMAYAKQNSLSAGTGGFDCCPEQARLFFAYYDNANWVDKNGTPIRDWQRAFKLWIRRDDMRQYERSQKC